ncbi:hypothetical protein QU487_06780 [Crenobacter sp. SG2305]|uniref:hypothetical protein n=1 Tax=Crenobacter oryzisoli TaxID=3056844 RepID=UPI0025AAC0DD|nr:hypothetical protein [Crenobacter sp. SG2305]MDN0082459.1 hypothetical protein [Crenobacter sp. SG2305]
MLKALMLIAAVFSTSVLADSGSLTKGNAFQCKPWPNTVANLADGAVVKCEIQSTKTGAFSQGDTLTGTKQTASGLQRIDWIYLNAKDGRVLKLLVGGEVAMQSTLTQRNGPLTVVVMRDLAVGQNRESAEDKAYLYWHGLAAAE